MQSTEHSFLFASLDSKQPRTARKVHIRRLFDVLQLSLLRNDFVRAQRAWAILIRCKEVDWRSMWQTAMFLVGERPQDDQDPTDDRIDFLIAVMRQNSNERETVLKELTLQFIHKGMHRKALDELSFHLPIFPYQDNPVLHVYAGLLAIYLAQPKTDALDPQTSSTWNMGLLRDAQTHLERAKSIDPDNTVATAFLEKLPGISQPRQNRTTPDSDDESMEVDAAGQRRKRMRK